MELWVFFSYKKHDPECECWKGLFFDLTPTLIKSKLVWLIQFST